ncbi:MAG TPA: serine hydrolase domain-containing protein, partial [Flavitalea sp.]|nr:serine hydrolase domain-containing protein [Flavitalea sp.]
MQIQKSTSALLFHLLFVLFVAGQTETHLPRSVPEKEGVSSAAIIQFLEAADKSKTSFHSFMLLRHGKVIAEGWWNPYRPDLLHTLYSTSKSFTATAVGFAVHEKLLSLDDKVKSFFPGQAPDTADIKL